MGIGFVTCVRLGLVCLEEIEALGGKLELLITLRDDAALKKAGRVSLDDYAARTGTPLIKVRHINDPESIEALRSANLDWLLVIGWSQIISGYALGTARQGVLGMHPTLLPEGRGRAPIPWTILKNLPETGVTLFQLSGEADNGPIADQLRIPVDPHETASSLYDKICEGHATLMRKVWPGLLSGNLKLEPQDESKATHWPSRKPADGKLSADMTVAEVDLLVRAVTHPYPGAFLDRGEYRLVIWSGQPATPQRLQPAGCVSLEFSDGVYWASHVERKPALSR